MWSRTPRGGRLSTVRFGSLAALEVRDLYPRGGPDWHLVHCPTKESPTTGHPATDCPTLALEVIPLQVVPGESTYAMKENPTEDYPISHSGISHPT